MSGPIATSDPLTPMIPDELLRQSGRPTASWLVRGWIAAMTILGGWLLATYVNVFGWGLAVLGVAAFFAVPSIIDAVVLSRLAARVDALERSDANALLEEIRDNATVKMLAPHAWLRIQEAKIHLVLDDGRAAAKAFAEAERVSTHAGDKTELISAQVHALVLAGDRKDARALLDKLDEDQLSDLDHLNFGTVLLSESGHNKEALAHVEHAREAFGDHPRVIAALALALARVDREDEAAAILDEAKELVEACDDQLAKDLHKRATKALRPFIKAKQKAERKGETKKAKQKGKGKGKRERKGKKGRKQKRREARKKAKAGARNPDGETVEETAALDAEAADAAEAIESEPEHDEKTSDEAEASETDEAAHESESDADEDESDAGVDESDAGVDESDAGVDESDADEDESDASDEQDDASGDEQDADEEVADADEGPADEDQQAEVAKAEPPVPAEDEQGDEGLDLASLARLALDRDDSESSSKLAEADASTSGLRRFGIDDTDASSGTLFRSALFSEDSEDDEKAADEEAAEASKPKREKTPSLFDMPSFGSTPTFAPPPRAKGPVLPKSGDDAPKADTPKVRAPKIGAPKIGAPKVGAPKVGVPKISAPAPKPVAPKAPALDLDDGWGDLGAVTPLTPPSKSDDDE